MGVSVHVVGLAPGAIIGLGDGDGGGVYPF